MPRPGQPDLKKFLDRRMYLQLNGSRKITGLLRGFDPFMNVVLDDTIEHVSSTERNNLGMVVIRGNSIVILELMDNQTAIVS